MPDKSITCRDCERIFPFTESEQAFYAEKGFASNPARCKPCRLAKKAERGEQVAPSRRSDGSEIFEGTCTDCGGPARVPFRPRTGAPIYCSGCYRGSRV